MAKIARTILNRSKGMSYSDVLGIIDSFQYDSDNNCEKESTIFFFDDGSILIACATTLSFKIVYKSTIPVWAK